MLSGSRAFYFPAHPTEWSHPFSSTSPTSSPQAFMVNMAMEIGLCAYIDLLGGLAEGSKSKLLTSAQTPLALQCHSLWSPSYLPPSWCHRASSARCTRSWWTPRGMHTSLWTSSPGSSPLLLSSQKRRARLTSCMSTSSQTLLFWIAVWDSRNPTEELTEVWVPPEISSLDSTHTPRHQTGQGSQKE